MSIAAVLEQARVGLVRVDPVDLQRHSEAGAFVVDIRPVAFREREGHIPGAVIIERNVLEWRLDPLSDARLPGGPALSDHVIVVCNEGYASSLAARDLRAIGFAKATDLIGGFRAYARLGLPIAPEASVLAD